MPHWHVQPKAAASSTALSSRFPDAEWAKKGNETYFGYKNHANIDEEHKFIRGYVPEICEKGYRNKPLSGPLKLDNRIKSSVRCRLEHIFGEQKMRMGNEVLRSIGFARARFWIGIRNLMYNMSRLVSLKNPKKAK